MADARYRSLEDLQRLARANESSPISLFHLALARLLTGEPIDHLETSLRAFQASFPAAPADFTNCRRHVSIAATALLLGRPVGTNPTEALAFAHRAWDGGWKNLDLAVEACAAAVSADDRAELEIWRERAERNPAFDWVETYEEALFLLAVPPDSLDLDAAAMAVTRAATETLLFEATISAAPLVWALSRSAPSVAELLAGRARAVDELVFGPSGEKPRLRVGRATARLDDLDGLPQLVFELGVSGRGVLAPGGYALAPFTYQLADLVDRILQRWARRPEPERTTLLTGYEGALARTDGTVTFEIKLARGVELSPQNEDAFRARIMYSWEHVRRSLRDVHALARVVFTRAVAR